MTVKCVTIHTYKGVLNVSNNICKPGIFKTNISNFSNSAEFNDSYIRNASISVCRTWDVHPNVYTNKKIMHHRNSHLVRQGQLTRSKHVRLV